MKTATKERKKSYDELIAGLRGDEGDEGGERGEGERGGDDVMREHVVGVLERVVCEHRPALEPFDG